MKCPKCGYLGFEAVDRCRNCGYEFSLSAPAALQELPIRSESDSTALEAFHDVAFVQSSSPDAVTSARESAGDSERTFGTRAARPRGTPLELPLFGRVADDEVPLITKPSPPRTPLSVRRATPEVVRQRPATTRLPVFEVPDTGEQAVIADRTAADGHTPASLIARLAAAGIDLLLLAAIDALVIYFTARICGLTLDELSVLPKGPLLAFLIFQNGGYLVGFTLRGQTLGKMATGIRVVPADEASELDLGHSIVRTLVWALLAVPAGLGFVTTLFSVDHRGLHDRCAGTRVVRTV